MPNPEAATLREGWTFIIFDGRMGLKIDDEWADDVFASLNQTLVGKAEIERQWAEYDRLGCPLMSYQKPTADWEALSDAQS